MKTFVDKDACIGCELCVSICPAVYRMEGTEVAQVYGLITAQLEDSVLEATDSCPVRAITIKRL